MDKIRQGICTKVYNIFPYRQFQVPGFNDAWIITNNVKINKNGPKLQTVKTETIHWNEPPCCRGKIEQPYYSFCYPPLSEWTVLWEAFVILSKTCDFANTSGTHLQISMKIFYKSQFLTAVSTDNPSNNALLCIAALEGGIYITSLPNTRLVNEKDSGKGLI
jgi:hypothetical protein